MSVMKEYHWPGNVRELKNIIERLVFHLGVGETINIENLPQEIVNSSMGSLGEDIGPVNGKKLSELIKRLEKKIIIEELKKSNGNRMAAAKAIGISRTNLISKIRQHNITL